MIVIGGNDYDPTPDLPDVMRKYGRDMVEALTSMHRGGRASVFRYGTKDELMDELSLRDNALKGMADANAPSTNLRYATDTDDPEGHLDPRFWDKREFYMFTLRPGANPADAVRSIFSSPSSSSKANVLECNSTMVAVWYRAMLETMGEAAFNAKFAAGGLVISPYHAQMPDGGAHPLFALGMIDTVDIDGAEDLIPGDCVYFRNFSDYGRKHPDGFWTGEHTLYIGHGKFEGFGTPALTEAALDQQLVDAYNDGLFWRHRDLADVPGLQPYAHRPVANKMVD